MSTEIEAVIDPGDAREVGISILRSPDGAEQTRISLFRTGKTRLGVDSLQIDISAASLRSDVLPRPPEIGPLDVPSNEPLRLRVFIDRSIVEVFANDRQCLTVRVYPERHDSSGISVFSRGGAAELISLETWQMHSIWPELTYRESE